MPASRRKKIQYRLFGEERARLARAVKNRYEAGLSVNQVASEFAIGMELTRNLLDEAGADIRQPAGGAAPAAPHEHRSPHRDTYVAGIVRNPRGHLLLIKPRNVEQGWRLPPAQNGLPADVLPHYACGRAFLDELNLKVPRRTTHLLAVDYAPKSPTWGTPEAFTLVFDAGTATPTTCREIHIPDGAHNRIEKWAWIPIEDIPHHTTDHHTQLIAKALESQADGQELALTHLGTPAT